MRICIEILNYLFSIGILGLTIYLGFQIKGDQNLREKERSSATEKGIQYVERVPIIKIEPFRKKVYVLLGLFIADVITLILLTNMPI